MRRAVLVILDGLRRDFVDAVRNPASRRIRRPRRGLSGLSHRVPVGHARGDRDVCDRLPPGAPQLAGQRLALLEDGALV